MKARLKSLLTKDNVVTALVLATAFAVALVIVYATQIEPLKHVR